MIASWFENFEHVEVCKTKTDYDADTHQNINRITDKGEGHQKASLSSGLDKEPAK